MFDDGDGWSIFWGVILTVALVFGFIWLVAANNESLDEQCKEQFGQEWAGKYDGYGPDFCVNKNGDAKYPQ